MPHAPESLAAGAATAREPDVAAPSSRGANLAVIGAVVALLLAGAVLHPEGHGDGTGLSLLGFTLPPMCAFRTWTGIPCPGCGLTRAIALLVHGRMSESLAMHPFGVVVVGLALLQIPPRAARVAGAAPGWTFRYDRLWGYALAATAILMTLWWVLRTGVPWLGA